MHIPAVYTRGENTGQCENCGILLFPPTALRVHGTLVACLQCHFVHQLTVEAGGWTADALMCRVEPDGTCEDADYCPRPGPRACRDRWACPYTPWHRDETVSVTNNPHAAP